MRIVPTDRDRLLISELAQVRVATGEQLGRIAGFFSKTRRNERLLKLTRAGVLARSDFGTIAGGRAAAYRLPGTRLGRTLRSTYLAHALAITDVYVALRSSPAHLPTPPLTQFRLGSAISSSPQQLIPDAYLELSAPSGVRAYFLEVDLGTEALPVWQKKVERYLALALSGLARTQLGHPRFAVLVVAHSARRAESIRSVVRKHTDKIFWFADLQVIKREGAYAPIWLRPEGSERSSLIDERSPHASL